MTLANHSHWLELAGQYSKRSNCIRRGVGAVIVRGSDLVSAGWNGVAESFGDCKKAGCPRCTNGGITGLGYDRCICIHAEQMAVAAAARSGFETKSSVMYVNLRPCLPCLVVAHSAGIRAVIFGDTWVYDDAFEVLYATVANQFVFVGTLAELSNRVESRPILSRLFDG